MGFRLPDLIVESVIREGFASVRRDSTIIDDVFEDLVQSFNSKKYGDREINRIKEFCRTKEVRIVHSFAQVPIGLPCVSIQLMADDEDKAITHLDDFEEDIQRTHTDPDDIANEVVLSGLSAESYDPLTGIVIFDDATDLSLVHRNQLFEDADGTTFRILGSIDTTPGNVSFAIDKAQEPNLVGPCQVRSSINFEQFEIRGTVDQVRLLIGVHAQDRLMTIYLYTLLKYFLSARKLDLVRRGYQSFSFSGSDFTRNNNYAEPVFERFLTTSGIVQDSWNSDKVIPIEDIEIEADVQRDEATNEQIGHEDQTVQVDDDWEQDE